MLEDSKLTQMLQTMSKCGWRITDQRRMMAQLFVDTEGYLSPKDVYEHMKQTYPGVSFDTVYRNLRLLSEMGVLEQFYFMEGGQKFRASCLDHHHHHLICVNCEKTLTFDYCPMDQVELPGHFRVMNHRFEIFGLCETCQQEESAVPAAD